jgi:predicted nicotinamide N-methyase
MSDDSRILDSLAQGTLEPWLIAVVKFVLSHTQSSATTYVPEIVLRLGVDSVSLWDQIERELNNSGAGPPYWAFAWAGGQALARHLLDNPALVAGRRVLDLASGSGLVGIAAKKAGAAHVIANDIDCLAAVAIALNAEANEVVIEANATDLLVEGGAFDPKSIDVVLVGDGFYDHNLSPRILRFVQRCRAAGCEVLVGDPGRADLPIQQLRKVGEHLVPVTHDCQHTAAETGHEQDHDIRRAAVWRLESSRI